MKKTELAIERCKTISTLQKILGGKWKIEILYYIAIREKVIANGEIRQVVKFPENKGSHKENRQEGLTL